MRVYRKFFLLLCAIVFSLTIGGVYAIWTYIAVPDPIETGAMVGLTGFYYKTEEVLPDDEGNHLDAQVLVAYVINNAKAGLNSKKGEELLTQIKEKTNQQLHSFETINASNLMHIFKEHPESNALEFTLQYVGDREVYCYIYTDADLEEAAAHYAQGVDSVRIPTYKTQIIRSGENASDWEDKGTALGYATVVRVNGNWAIDATTWLGGS